jgi:hypothetical protein
MKIAIGDFNGILPTSPPLWRRMALRQKESLRERDETIQAKAKMEASLAEQWLSSIELVPKTRNRRPRKR